MEKKQIATDNGGTSNTSDTTSERQLIERKEIPGTPFLAVRYDDKWFLTLGKYRLTEPMETYQEIEDDAMSTSWARILQIMQIMIEEHESNKGKAKNTRTRVEQPADIQETP